MAIFIASLSVLLIGAEKFVGSAEEIGLSFGIPPFIIGISVLAIGTSFPELITALFSVHSHHSEFVVGTVIGSNIANILLILGFTTMFSRSFSVTWDLLHGDLPLLFGSLLLLIFVIYPISTPDLAQFRSMVETTVDGKNVPLGARAYITFWESAVLVGGYVLYLYYYAVRNTDLVTDGIDSGEERPDFKPKSLFWLSVGIVGVVAGAQYTVESATALAALFNLGTEIIAASMVALARTRKRI